MTCTFLGHRDCPPTIIPRLEAAIKDLITANEASTFLVGNQGNFDLYARQILSRIREDHPQIQYYIVLAYMPNTNEGLNDDYLKHTLVPDGIEGVPKRFAINYRNKWMVEQSDYVITYITHSYGGAAKFARLAEKKNKLCIPLSP